MTDQQVRSEKETEGMVDYNENSSAQLQLVRLLSPLVRNLVSSMDEPETEFEIVATGAGQVSTLSRWSNQPSRRVWRSSAISPLSLAIPIR